MDISDDFSISTTITTGTYNPYDNLNKFDDCVVLLLACVYSPSLQRLWNAVSLLSLYDILLWADTRPQRIEPLTELILKGLEYDAFALDIISSLIRAQNFRDLFLRRKPQLLQGLTKASLANERSFAKYTPCIVALLASPLPDWLVMPSIVHSYISALVQAVNSKDLTYLPFLERVCRIYANILDHVNSRQRDDLIQALRALLGAGESTNWTALSCLASISSCGSETSMAHRWNMQSCTIFAGDKGKKVLRLVMSMLNSHLSCEDSAASSQSAIQEEVDMLGVISQAIDKSIVVEWIESKEGANLLRKIMEKIEANTHHVSIAAICTIMAYLGDLSRSFGTSLANVSTTICTAAVKSRRFDDPVLIDAMCKMLHFSPLLTFDGCKLLDLMLSTLCNSRPWTTTSTWLESSSLHAVEKALHELRTSRVERMLIAENLVACESTGVLERWTRLDTYEQSTNLPSRALIQCHQQICSLIIEVQSDLNIPSELKPRKIDMSSILRKLVGLSLHYSTSTKDNKSIPKTDLVVLLDAETTPHSGHGSQDWQVRLFDDLQREAQHQHSNVVARMNAVCRDLEVRAEINEQPLRETQAKLNEAKVQVEELSARLLEASTELQQRDTENQYVFEERQRLENVISNLLTENAADADRLKDFEHNENSAKLECQAAKYTVAELEQTVEELRRQILEQRGTFEADLAKAHQAEVLLQNQVISCNAQALELKAALDSERATTSALKATAVADSEQLRTASDQLSESRQLLVEQKLQGLAEIQRLETRLEKEVLACSEAQEHIAALELRLQAGRQVEQELHKTIESIKTLADEQINLQEDKHSLAMKSMADDLALTKERSKQANKILEDENAALRQALTKIKTSYERRCAEFEQAKDLSKRLMAVTAGAFSQASPMSSRRDSMLESADRNIVVKRHKGELSNPIKQAINVMSTEDITQDIADSNDKENTPPDRIVRIRRSFGREDSAILSQLSGLGI